MNKDTFTRAEKLYAKSIEILEQLQLENGGILASPPGKRYPYVYPRDHVISILAYIRLGMYGRARKALDFTQNAQFSDGSFPQRYNQQGKDASYKPSQIDGNGLVLYALGRYLRASRDKDYIRKNWEKIKKNTSYIQQNMQNEHHLVYAQNSIHEFPPLEKGYEIWANSVCYAGLKEAAFMAGRINKKQHMWEWKQAMTKLRKSILTYLWNTKRKSFIKNIRTKDSSSVATGADASLYAVADYHVLDDAHIHVRMTVQRIIKELTHPKLGGICRYPKYIGRNNAGWGPWPHFTLMIARHFIRMRDLKNSDKYISWVLKYALDNELPEHIATRADLEESFVDYHEAGIMRPDRVVMYNNIRSQPMFRRKGIAYAVLPLAWPHAEFIRTWQEYKKAFSV